MRGRREVWMDGWMDYAWPRGFGWRVGFIMRLYGYELCLRRGCLETRGYLGSKGHAMELYT